MDLKVLQREKYIKLRKELDKLEKVKLDKIIFEKFIKTREYIECENVLIYVSMGFEVDTLNIIKHSLENGKDVYAPLVTKEKRVMKFYKVNSLDDLTENKMGIFEPKAVDEWVGGKSLCVVPAIAYDINGYRIGYGGGYYDYFLSKNNVETFGIVYDDFVIDKVEVDCYDQRVNKLLTEKREINLNR